MSDLTAGQRETSRASSRQINNALVVAQLSLSVVLLIAAGLVLKSFQRLTQVDLGFRPEGVTSVTLALPRPHQRWRGDNQHFCEHDARASASPPRRAVSVARDSHADARRRQL